MPRASLEIDRVRDLPFKDLKREYLDPAIPVVIQGYTDSWPAAGTWSPAYLAEQFGNRSVPVVTMQDDDYANAETSDMTFRAYFEAIGAIGDPKAVAAASRKKQRHYLAQVDLVEFAPELLDDLEVPDLFPDESYLTTTMYAGGTLFSQLHCHLGGSATLCLFYGTKHVRLFAPDQRRHLYPYPAHSPIANMSRTVSKDPDAAKFPDFASAEYIDVSLSAGDVLVIPNYWWHSIDNEGFSVSAVMFFKSRWQSRLHAPKGYRSLRLWRAMRRLQPGRKRVSRLA